jgi:hypothetical protein
MLIKLLVVALVSITVQPVLAQERPIRFPGMDFVLHPNASIREGFAGRITELLVPSTEWEKEGLTFANAPARAYQVSYAKGGAIVTIDRVMTKNHCRLNIKIIPPASARIRHQIMIGTDKADWEIVRRDPPSSDGQPFARTYFLRLPNTGQLLGLVFYEGTWVELDWGGLTPVPPGVEDSLLRVTWSLAQRLREVYEQQIAPIAKSIDDGSPVPTRPDLPDADTRSDAPTRKQQIERRVLD